MIHPLRRILGVFSPGSPQLTILIVGVLLSQSGTNLAYPVRILYARAHGASAVQLGIFAAVFLVGALIVQMPLGWLTDRWGRVPVLLTGLIGHTIVSAVYLFVQAPDQLVVLRFLEGMTTASFQPAVAAYIADVAAVDQRGRAYGALSSAMSGGLLIGPLIGGVLMQQSGYVATFSASVVIEGVATLLVLLYVREPQQHHTVAGQPRQRVLTSDLLSPLLIIIYCGMAIAPAIGAAYGAFWSVYMRDLHASYTYLGVTYAAFALPLILLSPLAGALADRYGRLPMFLIPAIPVTLIHISYALVTNLTLLLILAVAEGVLSLVTYPAMNSLVADVSPPHARGRVQAVGVSVSNVLGIIVAFASLPLYALSRLLVFGVVAALFLFGCLAGAVGTVALLRRQQSQALAPLAAASPEGAPQ